MALPRRTTAVLALSFVGLTVSLPVGGAECRKHFRRGDPNQDGELDVSDAVTTLLFLFDGRITPRCLDAADADDSGQLDVTDAVYLLRFAFLGGAPLPDPGFTDCGVDPTPDDLGCVSYQLCAALDRCGENTCCPPGFYCAKAIGDCEGEGVCEPIPPDCPDVIDPVCGCDEITYDNSCLAAMAGVIVSHDGPCEPIPPPDDPTDRWVQTSGPPTGGDESIEVDPRSGTFYASRFGGTLFKSTDGESWTATTFFTERYRKISRILLDPAAADTIWAVAEAVPELVGSKGEVFKTTDGGQTYSKASLESVVQLGISPVVGGSLIACNFDGEVFITEDGGATAWVGRALPGGPQPGDTPPFCLGVAGGAEHEFWVTTSWSGRIFHTTDAGVTWDPLPTLPPEELPPEATLGGILVDPNDTRRVYVAFGGPGISRETPVAMRTDDGGASWHGLMVDIGGRPITLPHLHAATDTLYLAAGNELWRTGDHGVTWTRFVGGGVAGTVRFVDPTDIAIDPNDSNVLYLPTRGYGIAKTTDDGRTWRVVRSGPQAAEVSLISVLYEPPGGLLANGDREVYRSRDWGQTWEYATPANFGPQVDEIRVDPNDPQRIWITSDSGQMHASNDGGEHYDIIFKVLPPSSGFRYGSIYALAAAPAATAGQPDRIYALKSGFGIWKSDDGGADWTFLVPCEVDYTYTLAVDPDDPDVMFAGHNPKPFETAVRLRRTKDGGDTFDTSLSVTGARALSSVAIDPSNTNRVYAACATDTGGRLYESADGGDSWNPIDAPSFANVHAMAVHPADPGYAIAALWGGGLFFTDDRGGTWREIVETPTVSASAVLLTAEDPPRFFVADRGTPRLFEARGGGASPEWSELFNAGEAYYRVATAAMSPSEPGVVYASIFGRQGPMSGSLFRIEGGQGHDVTGSLPTPPIALAVHPTIPGTVYACMHGAENGAYKSTDSGASWSRVTGAASGIPQSPPIGFNGVVVDPARPQTVYLFGGSDAQLGPEGIVFTGAAPEFLHTVYKSVDGGNSWVNLNDGNLGAISGAIKGLAFLPGNPDVLFAGALRGMFVSEDGGVNWARADTGLTFKHLGGVGLSNDGATLYAPTLGDGVHVASLDAVTHTPTWSAASDLTTTVYHVQVAVHPDDGNTLFASAYPGGVFKSVDRGRTWTEQNFGLPTLAVDDPTRQGYYALAFAPSSPDVMYLGIYGRGVYRSEDGGGSWLARYGAARRMAGAPIAALAVDPANPDQVWVATEAGVLRTTNGGESWSEFSDGLDNNDVRTLLLETDGDLLAGTRGDELYRLPAGTSTWEQMPAFAGLGSFWTMWNRAMYQYTSVIFHPHDPNVIYIGTFPAGVFKSEDGGQTWREHNVGFTNDGIFYLTFHPHDPDIIYAGTYNGVNRSLDGGDHWEVWDAGWPDEQWVFSIQFDPRDPRVMYACSKNGANKGSGVEGFHGTVMKSVNGGETWQAITAGLTDQEFFGIVVDPVTPDTVYLSGQRAVYISRNTGGLWEKFDTGLLNPFPAHVNNVTQPLTVSPEGKYLYLGSLGSGVFRRRLRP